MGSHLILNVSGLEFGFLDSMEKMGGIMEKVNDECKINVLGVLKHKFQPQGLSIVYLLAESHLSVHCSPELGMCYIDFFHCGTDPVKSRIVVEKAKDIFDEELRGNSNWKIVDR